MGTLLAFTIVAISVLVLRYIPPLEAPPPLSCQHSAASLSYQSGGDIQEIVRGKIVHSSDDGNIYCQNFDKGSTDMTPLLQGKSYKGTIKLL